MPTRSTIGMIQSNGSVIGVYCHFDGYLDHVGAILSKHYRDSTKVKELITLGRNGISILGKEIGEKQDFNKPADRKLSWCLFYGRDRGERNTKMTSYYESAIDFSREYDNDYGYLFDPESNIWFAFKDRKLTYIPGQSTPLVNAMWKKITSSVATESKQFSLAQTAKKILKESDNDSRTFEDNCEILQKFESEDKLYSKEAREILQDAHELTEDELNDAVNDLMKQYRLSDPRINKKPDHRRPNPWDRDYRDGDFR